MIEAALWLNCILSGVTAFSLICFRRWRVFPAILVAIAVNVAIWFIAVISAGGGLGALGFGFVLSMNILFAALFAGAGACAAKFAADFRG